MKRKARQFHCEKCGSPCTIYRKGKKHRVLVCPTCGVLATNPLSFKGLLGGAATGATVGSVVPGYGTAAGAVIGGVAGLFSGKKKERATPPSGVPGGPLIVRESYSTEERVRDALQ